MQVMLHNNNINIINKYNSDGLYFTRPFTDDAG